MFYRRKVILALLEALGGELNKIDFRKHLFLFTRAQDEPAFDFVPYRYGCFSFGAEADRAPMIRVGLLHEGTSWKKKTKTSYLPVLTPEDRERIAAHERRYGHLRGRALVREVYTAHPYYAIHSKVVGDVLEGDELDRVAASRPEAPEPTLFTIGYEGRSLEAYLNKLIEHRVEVLCDVRKNPVSRKFGFSMGLLRSAVGELGMRYVHVPELGIASGKRKALSSPEAYARLFDEYERRTLPERGEELARLHALLREHERVALTCFEASHTDCHRSRVTEALARLPEWNYPVLHI